MILSKYPGNLYEPFETAKSKLFTWKPLQGCEIMRHRSNYSNTGEDTFLKRRLLDELFMKERVPFWVAASGYVILALVAIGVIPLIFPALKWYHVLTCYIVSILFVFCNAYGTDPTNWNCASTYGKLVLFLFSMLVSTSDGGAIAGLAACGVMFSIIATASDLMQDTKTSHLTGSSPLSMFVSQILGTALGWLHSSSYSLSVVLECRTRRRF